MTQVVLDSADLVEAVTTGVTPVPKGIAEDNAAQAAKREALSKGRETKPTSTETKSAAGETPKDKPETKSAAAETAARNADIAKLDDPDDPDNQPEEDGISPRERRIFTAGMLKTIGKKFRAQREAEALATTEYNRSTIAAQEVERLRRENEALKRASKPAGDVSSAPASDAAPKRADFENDEAYQDALIDFRVEQKMKAREAEHAKQQQEKAAAEERAAAEARITAARELVPDYDAVVGAVDIPVAAHIVTEMQKSELFAELGWHFAKNQQDLIRLNGLSPARSLVELGKIESKLTPFAKLAKDEASSHGATPSTETGSAPRQPRSPAPTIRPLNAGNAGQVSKDEAEMTVGEVIRTLERKKGLNLTARKRH